MHQDNAKSWIFMQWAMPWWPMPRKYYHLLLLCFKDDLVGPLNFQTLCLWWFYLISIENTLHATYSWKLMIKHHRTRLAVQDVGLKGILGLVHAPTLLCKNNLKLPVSQAIKRLNKTHCIPRTAIICSLMDIWAMPVSFKVIPWYWCT